MSQEKHATRSWLFTPATRPERFGKAADVGSDVLIIDLEDSVSPGDKSSALRTALETLSTPQPGVRRALRINGLDTAAGITDLSELLPSNSDPDFLVLPKTESEGHLLILDRLLTAAGKRARLVGLIESVRAVAALDRIAAATPRLAALMLGAADMAADLGAEPTWEALAATRAALLAACARADVLPVDSPFFDVKDQAGVTHEVAVAKALGFRSKAAIHPNQISPINAALTPTDAEVAHARKVLAVNDAGVGTVDGQMIDEAVARQARRTLAAAGA